MRLLALCRRACYSGGAAGCSAGLRAATRGRGGPEEDAMDRIARRAALKSLAAFAVAAPAVLRVTQLCAAEFTMKLGNNVPATHPLSARLVEAAEAIRGRPTAGSTSASFRATSSARTRTASVNCARARS